MISSNPSKELSAFEGQPKQGAAVADSGVLLTNVITQFNLLLAQLRLVKIIAT